MLSQCSTEPAAAPENVSVSVLSSTEIGVSWDEVPAIDQNGVITMYEVQFEPLQTFNDKIFTNSVNITNTSMMYTVRMDLEEYVEYNISVRAYTSAGSGPYSDPLSKRTLEDGKKCVTQDEKFNLHIFLYYRARTSTRSAGSQSVIHISESKLVRGPRHRPEWYHHTV